MPVHFCPLDQSRALQLESLNQLVRHSCAVASSLRHGAAKELRTQNNSENIRLLTLSEAAELLQVSKRTLQRMIKLGQLPAFKVGGQWRVREMQLRQWVEFRESSNAESEVS